MVPTTAVRNASATSTPKHNPHSEYKRALEAGEDALQVGDGSGGSISDPVLQGESKQSISSDDDFGEEIISSGVLGVQRKGETRLSLVYERACNNESRNGSPVAEGSELEAVVVGEVHLQQIQRRSETCAVRDAASGKVRSKNPGVLSSEEGNGDRASSTCHSQQRGKSIAGSTNVGNGAFVGRAEIPLATAGTSNPRIRRLWGRKIKTCPPKADSP